MTGCGSTRGESVTLEPLRLWHAATVRPTPSVSIARESPRGAGSSGPWTVAARGQSQNGHAASVSRTWRWHPSQSVSARMARRYQNARRGAGLTRARRRATTTAMRDLTLAERLLARVAEISRRGDVIVHTNSGSWGGRIGRWKEHLPEDMFAFYERLNGLVFHYAFADAPDDWNGFALLALDEDGKKVIDPRTRYLRLPRQAASRYPGHFFQPGAVSPATESLFFLGDDAAWGVLLLRDGDAVRFRRWDNDGFLHAMPDTFTAVIERLIDNGFAHTWAYDAHPDTDRVRARLATPTAGRETFALEVLAREEASASAMRRAVLDGFDDETLDKVVRALGLAKATKGAAREAKVAAVDAACAEPVGEKAALAAMRATGHRRPSAEGFARRFVVGSGTLAKLSLRLRYAPGVKPVILEQATLVRVLDALPGVDVGADFPGPRALIQCAYPPKCGIWWSPFVNYHEENENEAYTAMRYEVTLPAARAAGLEAGRTYASTALPSVEG